MTSPIQRIIQESVPGKQITLAHIIASPRRELFVQLGLDEKSGAVGIMTITPCEGVIIAADIATKSGAVDIGFLDRFGGSLLLTGDVASVESALCGALEYFNQTLHYTVVALTRT